MFISNVEQHIFFNKRQLLIEMVLVWGEEIGKNGKQLFQFRKQSVELQLMKVNMPPTNTTTHTNPMPYIL